MSLETSGVVAELVGAHRAGDVVAQPMIEVEHELGEFLRHELSTNERWLAAHSVEGVILDPQRTRTSEIHIELHGEVGFSPRGEAPVRVTIELFADDSPLSCDVVLGTEEDPWRPEMLGYSADHPAAQSDAFVSPRFWFRRRFDDQEKLSARDALRDRRAMHIIQSIEQGYRPSQIAEELASEEIGVLELILILRTATGCSLMEAKMLGEVWSSGKASDPEEFDARILELFRARAPLHRSK